jgi:hypothetical protein
MEESEMIERVIAASCVAATGLVFAIGIGSPAHAETQPADLGNVGSADRGASASGPHCHFVLPASGKGAFDSIITGAAHQAHTRTGLPTGVFQATPCP